MTFISPNDMLFLFMYILKNDPNIGNNPEKHYITIFMVGTVSDNSRELVNLETHKCESWNWIPWENIVDMRSDRHVTLFDPMIHLIEGLNTREPAFLH